MEQHFEWDEDKNERNIAKHGINFVDALKLFETAYMCYSSPRNDEPRMIGIGKVGSRTVAVIYTMRKNIIRIISARIARRKERKLYIQWLEK